MHGYPTRIAVLTIAKMAVQVQKDGCVLWFHESKSAVVFERQFRTTFGTNPPLLRGMCGLKILVLCVKTEVQNNLILKTQQT
jgi:hypothetical protein